MCIRDSVFSVPEGETPVCPVCKATGDKLELVEEAKANRYAGTQTEKNLEAAFAGESQARNKYTYFASVAKKEGYEQIDVYKRQAGARSRNAHRCWRSGQARRQ